MQLLRSDPEGRRWLQDLLYYMLSDKQFGYCYTFHNVELIAVKQPFAFVGGLPALGGVSLDPRTERLLLLIYYPIMSRLGLPAQMSILQHEAIHIIDGHLSSYGLRLREEYGDIISNIAMDVYVNQKIDIKPMQDAGLGPVTIEMYGFPPNLSSEDYCKLVKQGVDNGEIELPPESSLIMVSADGQAVDKNGNPIFGEVPNDPQAGTKGQPGDDFTGKGQYIATEVFKLSKAEANAADQATREVINSVDSTLRDNKQDWGRGFRGADYDSFIEASKRQAIVPWSFYLRMMESKNRAEIVVPTRRRLSRRSKYHLGRVRRYGLDVAFMVDTSGSMGERELRLVDPELRGMHARGAHISVIHCDTQVAKIEEYSPFNSLDRFHGRGGTEFSAGLIAVREMNPRPGMFVGYTDGWGGIEEYRRLIVSEYGEAWWQEYMSSNPTRSPDGIESLWLIPEGCMKPEEFQSRVVPWGTVVVIPAEKDTEAA